MGEGDIGEQIGGRTNWEADGQKIGEGGIGEKMRGRRHWKGDKSKGKLVSRSEEGEIGE